MQKQTEQEKIGYFIKNLREQKGYTQSEFAKLLKTSQSAVARMESGGQNFTTGELERMSKVLGRRIVSISSSMDFEIHGGKKLHGEITTNSSKNGALALMCASLLNDGKTTLHGIPKIEEVFRLVEILESIGVQVRWLAKNSIEINPPKKFDLKKLDGASAGRIRSALMMIGALAHKVTKFELPHAGGCKMGNRTIAAHKFALEELGIFVTAKSDFYLIEKKKTKPADIVLYESSDTAAINAIIASSLVLGETTIKFAPPNYQVQEVCFFLESLGVKIDGIGTTTLKVHGIEKIDKNIEYSNSEDPIESMMFLSAAITTNSSLLIKRCPIDFLELELYKLKKMGLKFKLSKKYFANNGRTKLVDIKVFESKLKAPNDKLHALPYPGINTDNLPFFVPIATQVKGVTMIHDWMWENRAIYFTELNRLGAKIELADPHRVYVTGVSKLHAAQIVCPPALRPAMIIMIAMLAADGVSVLRNVYSIKRGYEEVAERLNSIGADIKILSDVSTL